VCTCEFGPFLLVSLAPRNKAKPEGGSVKGPDLLLDNAQYLFVRNQSPILGISFQNFKHLFVRNYTPFKHVSVAVNERLNLVFRKFDEEFLSHVNPWSKFN
jgi:hypothetical protein